jgi:hypothetical protein
VRDRDGHLAHRDTRAGPSAGGAELRWYRCQIPVNGLSAARPGLHISSFLQPNAGTSVALGIPAELATDLLAGRPATICWQQFEQSPPVLVGLMLGLSHGIKLAVQPYKQPQRYSGAIMIGGQKIQVGLAHARQTAEVTVEADTYQIAVEPGITITAPRTTSRDIKRHKASNYKPG